MLCFSEQNKIIIIMSAALTDIDRLSHNSRIVRQVMSGDDTSARIGSFDYILSDIPSV